MKKAIAFGIALLFLPAMFAGCGNANNPEQGENSISHSANDFQMNLFSDKEVYKTTDVIQIWATLEYTGNDDAIMIWSSDPYMIFSITDGKGFDTGGVAVDVLLSTVLTKGETYRFDYQKSGGWSADDPDAAFWENFYQEKDLRLPAGEYTITLNGAFSLTETILDSRSGLVCELKIRVEK